MAAWKYPPYPIGTLGVNDSVILTIPRLGTFQVNGSIDVETKFDLPKDFYGDPNDLFPYVAKQRIYVKVYGEAFQTATNVSSKEEAEYRLAMAYRDINSLEAELRTAKAIIANLKEQRKPEPAIKPARLILVEE